MGASTPHSTPMTLIQPFPMLTPYSQKNTSFSFPTTMTMLPNRIQQPLTMTPSSRTCLNILTHVTNRSQMFSTSHLSNNNLPTPVCAPFSIPVNTDGGMVSASFNVPVNTDGDVPLVVQVATIPSRSQTVIMQGPALAARLSTTQAQCRPVMQASVGSSRVKKVAKTNAERCELYRIRQKTKKKEGDEELRRLEDKNKTLKAKETALRNKAKRMKE